MNTRDKLNQALGLYHHLASKLHKLNNTWPCGIRSIDDRTDSDREYAKEDVRRLQEKVNMLRAQLNGIK